MNDPSLPVSSNVFYKRRNKLKPTRKNLLAIVAFMGLMVVSGSVMAGGASSLGFLGVGAAHIVLMYVFHFTLRAK